jgi:transposase-like protein
MNSQQRRHFSAEDKVAILRRHFLEKVSISDLCDQSGLTPTTFYNWQKVAFENLSAAFQQKGRRAKSAEAGKEQKIAQLEAKLTKKNEVLAELMEEHTALKKSLGEP